MERRRRNSWGKGIVKLKVMFMGGDAPRSVLEVELPPEEPPTPPIGYHHAFPVAGEALLREIPMGHGSLLIKWKWPKRPDRGKTIPGAFRCQVHGCGKEFGRSQALAMHMKAHRGAPLVHAASSPPQRSPLDGGEAE